MQSIYKVLTISITLFLTACSSSGSSTSPSADLQGDWAAACVQNGDDMVQAQLTISGSSFQRSVVTFYNTDLCTTNNYLSVNTVGTFVVLDTVTTLANGDAKHLDITFANGTYTAGTTTLAVLESQGTTLQDLLTSEGIEDITNVPLSDLGIPSANLFSIYQVDTTGAVFGEGTASQNGSSAALRHTQLDLSDIYTKQ